MTPSRAAPVIETAESRMKIEKTGEWRNDNDNDVDDDALHAARSNDHTYHPRNAAPPNPDAQNRDHEPPSPWLNETGP
eukprot:CAMPEP_0181117520 /NCGR_PEP_ID=MMETSP1071-20121207/22572_1 /TAXON_ID=35127 /ORGANISM="Thalassiosira sp., Strain NH16" /LENGTH=77 /DNA_ID=CAMNT_0023201925 /DNA_START=25 /DNA_END=259 /DNA_ORIENTATION=+